MVCFVGLDGTHELPVPVRVAVPAALAEAVVPGVHAGSIQPEGLQDLRAAPLRGREAGYGCPLRDRAFW